MDRLIALDKKDPKCIAIIGDALTDIWIHGTLMECQDNCPKFIEHSRVITPGGAANAANCLSDWNVKVDLFGQENRETKTRYLIDNRIVFRHDKMMLYTQHQEWSNFVKYDAVLLCDYDKGFLTPEYMHQIISRCNELHIPIVADVKRDYNLYKGAITKGNAFYTDNVVVRTRGADLPLINGKVIQMPNDPVQCINHVGAGDCFAAYLTLALAYGFPLQDAVKVAHTASRQYVQYPHNRPPKLLDMQVI